MQKIPFFARIDASVIAFMALMLTCVLWDTWSTRLDYAFGYLMPVFMLYVIWDRLPKIEKYFLGKPSQNNGGLLAAGTTFLFGGMAVCGFAGFMLFLSFIPLRAALRCRCLACRSALPSRFMVWHILLGQKILKGSTCPSPTDLNLQISLYSPRLHG